MMGMTMADARDCTYWEYTAVLSVWNERHKTDEDDAFDASMPPDPDMIERYKQMVH